jgi:hypothetical protein
MKRVFCETTKKRYFPTMLHAEIRAESMAKHLPQPLYAYQCPHCDGWHLTKSPNFETILQINLIKPTPCND